MVVLLAVHIPAVAEHESPIVNPVGIVMRSYVKLELREGYKEKGVVMVRVILDSSLTAILLSLLRVTVFKLPSV